MADPLVSISLLAMMLTTIGQQVTFLQDKNILPKTGLCRKCYATILGEYKVKKNERFWRCTKCNIPGRRERAPSSGSGSGFAPAIAIAIAIAPASTSSETRAPRGPPDLSLASACRWTDGSLHLRPALGTGEMPCTKVYKDEYITGSCEGIPNYSLVSTPVRKAGRK